MKPPKPFFTEHGMLSLYAEAQENGARLAIGAETFCDGTEWHDINLDADECRALGQLLLESATYSNPE